MNECNDTCKYYKNCWSRGECLKEDGEECAHYEPDRPHGECNQCLHYEGVHGVQGHAPCSFWGIGGVLSSDYCSRFEKGGEEK